MKNTGSLPLLFHSPSSGGPALSEPTVFLVDDDEAIRESGAWLFSSAGLRVETFPSAEAFQAAYDPARPGCLVLDLRMPGLSGLELQAWLNQQSGTLPIIFLTAHGDVPAAVRALKAHALDFLQKPVNDAELLEKVRRGLQVDAERRRANDVRARVAARLESLTQREREVLHLLRKARSNRQVGAALGISEKTVEVHRKHLLHKMGVHTAIELVKVIEEYLALGGTID